MPEHKNCTLIITTYNWPEALRMCLASVAWQTVLPKEVLIADDGSNAATCQMVTSISRGFPVEIRFFTQEKQGKRKTRIDNIAIAEARYPYLIFIDHDMVLHPEFIRDHLSLVEPGYFINGSRFLCDKVSTEAFLKIMDPVPGQLAQLKGKNRMNKIRSPFLMDLLAHRYRTSPDKVTEVRGCNMSFWKDDLVAVNGYDERYMGWGREDSDIALRLFNNGVGKKSIKFGGIGYHLWHNPGNKTDDDKYQAMLQDAANSKSKWAAIGLDQHLAPESLSDN